MSSRPREKKEMEIDAYMKPEAPLETDTGHLDAGHVCFSAIPRAAAPPLVVARATSGAVEEPARSCAGEGNAARSGQHMQESTSRAGSAGSRDASKTAEEGRCRSAQPAQGAEGREPHRWGAGAKHGSAASLDSAASNGSQMRSAAAKDPGRSASLQQLLTGTLPRADLSLPREGKDQLDLQTPSSSDLCATVSNHLKKDAKHAQCPHCSGIFPCVVKR